MIGGGNKMSKYDLLDIADNAFFGCEHYKGLVEEVRKRFNHTWSSGCIPDTEINKFIEEVKQFTNEELEKLIDNKFLIPDYNLLISPLKKCKLYTLFCFSEFGFPAAYHIKLININVGKYAQYHQAITMTFKYYDEICEQHLIEKTWTPHQTLIIWDGWHEIYTNHWIKTWEEKCGEQTLQCRESDLCFSKNHVENALKSVSVDPIIKII